MKKTALLLPLLVAAMISCNNTNTEEKTTTADTTTVATAPAKEEAPPPPMDSATQAKMWMEYMTPGDMHKILASFDGKWTSESVMWMDPSKPNDSMKSTSTAEYKMVMGGRYSKGTMKGNMMGMPFEGESLTAYDNAKKVFVTTWIDNMGTGIMHMEGTYDAATKTLNFKGSCVDPMSGKDMTMREVLTMTDDKHQTMEMYATGPGGKEYKSMVLWSTKK